METKTTEEISNSIEEEFGKLCVISDDPCNTKEWESFMNESWVRVKDIKKKLNAILCSNELSEWGKNLEIHKLLQELKK